MGWITDYEKRIDVYKMSQERLDKVKRGLKEKGLGGILALDEANMRYIVGTKSALDPGTSVSMSSYVLLPTGAEPIYFAGGMGEGAPLPRPSHWWLGNRGRTGIQCGHAAPFEIPEAYAKQPIKFANQIKDELKAHNILNETLGVTVNQPVMIEALNKAGIKTDVPTASKLMQECREIKTADEVECLRVASMISDACTVKMKEAIKPGVTERQLLGVIAKHGYELGAENFTSFHLESGPHTWPNYGGRGLDRAVRIGDLLYAEIAVTFMGYRNCFYTGTFSVGRPTQAQKDAWIKARDWVAGMQKALRPGNTTRDVALAQPSHEEFGWPDEDSAIMMQWCHSIGLAGHSEGISISRIWALDYPYPIKADMCFATEAICPDNEKSVEYPNGQACRLEDDVHVTSSGLDHLTKIPRDEIMVCDW